MAIQQPRCVLLAALALVVTVPRAARAQREWSPPVYRPAATNPPPAPDPRPTVEPAPAPPGYAPGYGPPASPGYARGYGPPAYVPPSSPAQPEQPEHAGFFLRLHFGLGFDSFSGSGGTSGTTQLSGPGISLAVALGGAVAHNLAVFGNFFESGAMQLTRLETSRTDLIGADNAALSGLGAGVVYYLEPLNLYLSGAVALTVFFIEDVKGKTLAETQGGVGFEGMVGKEFWVSPHWGVGGAIEILGATSMKDKNDSSTSWTAEGFNVVLSASYF